MKSGKCNCPIRKPKRLDKLTKILQYQISNNVIFLQLFHAHTDGQVDTGVITDAPYRRKCEQKDYETQIGVPEDM
jgi:hypothetical protein